LIVDSSGTTTGHGWIVIAAHPLPIALNSFDYSKEIKAIRKTISYSAANADTFCPNDVAIPL
jgi:hypothetical protein